MPDFQSMMDSFNSPPIRHAMFVHLPIVLAMVGCVLAILSAAMPRNATLRAVAIGCQVALVMGAFLALNSGEAAEEHVSSGGVLLTRSAQTLLGQHEDMADRVWMFGVGGVALLSLAGASRRPGLRVLFSWLAVALSVVAMGWIGQTANLGGKLVYQHGVGTPQPVGQTTGVIRPPSHDAAGAARGAASPAPAKPSTDDAGANGSADSAASSVAPAGAAEDVVKATFFREQVLTVFTDRCFNCHNEDRVAAGKSGGLDQTSRETMLRGGRSGPAIVPGKPEESLLLRRIRHDDPDEDLMPPRGGKLPDETIAKIEQWIRDGAVWPESSQ
jgi:uncharacterized membrane protein